MANLFGGQSSVGYSQSPEQQQMWQMIAPLLARLSTAGTTGQGAYNIPTSPEAPQAILPNANWWSQITPEVKQGLYAPYKEALNVLGEQMGKSGGSGSARGGLSGAYGVAAGRLGSGFAQNIGTQAWNMTYPQMAQQQQNNWGQAQNQWQAQLQQNMFPYTALAGQAGGAYSNPVVSQSPNYLGTASNAAMSAAMLYSLFSK